MSRREPIRLRLRLSVGRPTLKWAFALLILLGAAPELSSENVTLTTFYPAPSGVYSKLITSGVTYLARDGGSVGIGTTSPGKKLDVSGTISATSITVGGNMDSQTPVAAQETDSASNPACTLTNWNTSGQITCGAGKYPTFASGVIGNFVDGIMTNGVHTEYGNSGSPLMYNQVLCCTCPTGLTFAPYCP